MIEEYYDAGGDHAHLDLGVEKRAFVGAAVKGLGTLGAKAAPYVSKVMGQGAKAWQAGRAAAPAAAGAAPKNMLGRAGQAIGKGWGATGGRVWNAGKAFAAPAGAAIEKGAASGAGKVLGEPGKQLAANVVKGVPGQAAKDAVTFGGFSAALEGGLGAAGAEEGQRGKAFLEGAGHGALSGAAMGGLMGGPGGAFKNVRRSSLQQAAKRNMARPGASGQLFPKQEAARLADQQLNRGFFGSLKDTAKGGGSIGRAGSAQNAAGGLGQFGAEWIAPAMILPASLGGGNPFAASEPEAPAPQPTPAKVAALAPAAPPMPAVPPAPPEEPLIGPAQARLLTSVGGSAATGIPTGVGISRLSEKGYLGKGPKSKALAGGLQALGAGAGILGGSVVGQKLFPDVETEAEQKLEQIDFDKLMRYYKRPEEQV